MKCGCGVEVGDGAALEKVGWQKLHDGNGGFALFAHCGACQSTIAIRALTDAAQCHVCHRIVTGRSQENDPKVHVAERGDDGRLYFRVLCRNCASRTGVGYQALSMLFVDWVRTEDRRLLKAWRSLWLPLRRNVG